MRASSASASLQILQRYAEKLHGADRFDGLGRTRARGATLSQPGVDVLDRRCKCQRIVAASSLRRCAHLGRAAASSLHAARCVRHAARRRATGPPISSSSRRLACYSVHDASFDASDRLLTRTDPLIESALDMIGRYDHPFTLLTHLDARWPSLHRDDACVVHADAPPNVEITSPPRAVRFSATPCTIGSSTRAIVPSVCRVISTRVGFVSSSRRFVSPLGRFAATSATDAPCASTPPPVRVPRLRRYGLNACRDEVSSLAVSYEVSRHRLENAHIGARAGFADDGTTRLAVGIARRDVPHVSISWSVATYLVEPTERG
jgi:hypothetical protein